MSETASSDDFKHLTIIIVPCIVSITTKKVTVSQLQALDAQKNMTPQTNDRKKKKENLP